MAKPTPTTTRPRYSDADKHHHVSAYLTGTLNRADYATKYGVSQSSLLKWEHEGYGSDTGGTSSDTDSGADLALLDSPPPVRRRAPRKLRLPESQPLVAGGDSDQGHHPDETEGLRRQLANQKLVISRLLDIIRESMS